MRRAAAFLVGAVLGVVGVAAVLAVGLPIWVWPIVVVAGFLGFVRVRARALLRVPLGEVPCPRCASSPRTAAGWCRACTEQLQASPLPRDHPLQPFFAAIVARDFATAGASLAPQLRVSFEGGPSATMPRQRWVSSHRFSLRTLGGSRTTLLGLHVDPADADVLWSRTRDESRGVLGLRGLDVVSTTKLRQPHGLITETTAYPSQAPAPPATPPVLP